MKYRYLPALVMLSAGAITIFICLYNRYETLYSLKLLLAVLIIFLIIGSLSRRALIKISDMGKEDNKTKIVVKAVEEENPEEKTDDEDSGQPG
ncbi:hypothetical protein GCWU000282_02759 [Catonella morbi ATCC 51271]|uniref:Uncharacterized protein n=1 Tax=Catonella morbi ATCC 51271 TaxID=592026 RepID=V2Y2K6_9FIRM|nr:hypothetical protein [Catonella morbi]ESL01941.1 hypothetical protein GCWU000282_02759 [Catonella morbi ATCC 51271]